jgi:DNA-binding CsgD family transcriptional regulator
VRDVGGRWPLIGRDRELREFDDALRDRACTSFLIGGPAGTGKSRLAEECLQRAHAAGWRVARAAASAAAATVPLGAIAHLLPEHVDLGDAERGLDQVLKTMVQKDRRLVVMVDDVPLLDAASAVLLTHLTRRRALFLIGTVRTESALTGHVRELVTMPASRRTELSELGPDRVAQLLTRVLGGDVAQRSLQALTDITRGNVLYLREVVLGAHEAGTLLHDGDVWVLDPSVLRPTTRLREVLHDRLVSAGAEGRPLIELLALAEPVSSSEAEAVVAPSVVTQLEHKGLIHVARDERRTLVTLAHPLHGELVRADMPLTRKRLVLRRQIERVESRGARRKGDVERLASWSLAATGTADPVLLTRAAVTARYAHDYEQAIRLLRAMPEPAHGPASLLLLGESLFQSGDVDAAEAALGRAARLAATDTQTRDIAVARSLNLFWGRSDVPGAMRCLDWAGERLRDPAARSSLELHRTYLHIFSGRLGEHAAWPPVEEPVGTGPSAEADIRMRYAAARTLGFALLGRSDDAMDGGVKAHEVHQRLLDSTLPHPALQLNCLITAAAEAGELARAREYGAEAFAAVSAPPIRSWTAFHLGRAEWLAGDLVSARRWFAESVSLGRAAQGGVPLTVAVSGLMATAALLGDVETAVTLREQSGPTSPSGLFQGEERLGEAWLLAVQGYQARARRVLLEGARAAREHGHVASEMLLLTDVARLGGARACDSRVTELARSCSGRLASVRQSFVLALARDDADALLTAADALASLGAYVLAAEGAATAAHRWWRVGRPALATQAVAKSVSFRQQCPGVQTPAMVVAGGAARLSAREREIAFLAQARLSSQEIADELGISVRTVNNHLAHVYSKLGISERRELAKLLREES